MSSVVMMEKIDCCCCTCERNKRTKDKDGTICCECEIDGHYIGYNATFTHSCPQYVLDKAYRLGGRWHEKRRI